MRKKRISEVIGNINPRFINEASEYYVETKELHRPIWLKWSAAAACFAVLLIAGTIILPKFFRDDVNISGKYKYTIYGEETDIEWPWEYKTNSEKYQTIDFNGKEYHIKSLNPIGSGSLGDVLGTCEATGLDSYTDKKYTETYEVRKINDVSEEMLIAAGNDNEYYVYIPGDMAKPATFGELLDLYGLAQTLKLNHFTACNGYDEEEYFSLNNDAYIWQILSECRNAKLLDEADTSDKSNRYYLSFTATSDMLGAYKNSVCISSDGYFETSSLFDYNYIYYIGEDAAKKIITYVQNNSTEAEFEQYELTIAGTLTEIGDDYVLIDDTVLCTNKEEGTVYKVFTDDIRMVRCIECTDIKVGDTVEVKYNGILSDNNEISGAYSMYNGILAE